jgi:hypothetical protein
VVDAPPDAAVPVLPGLELVDLVGLPPVELPVVDAPPDAAVPVLPPVPAPPPAIPASFCCTMVAENDEQPVTSETSIKRVTATRMASDSCGLKASGRAEFTVLGRKDKIKTKHSRRQLPQSAILSASCGKSTGRRTLHVCGRLGLSAGNPSRQKLYNALAGLHRTPEPVDADLRNSQSLPAARPGNCEFLGPCVTLRVAM